MIDAEKRKAVYLLHQEGMSDRQIAANLRISRETVHSIIKNKGAPPNFVRRDKIHIDPELLKRLYEDCDGYAQRVHEKLVEEEGIAVKYSTLTRLLRDNDISRPQKSRCSEVPDEPGAEMQHDTTTYVCPINGRPTRVTASLLYLRYSKRRYLRFYRAFNRFKMKCFLYEALMFWRYAAPLCIIDNTNLARLRGTGKTAVIVPEMATFAKRCGFQFVCHEKGHANRKAGEEKALHTVETNFLPGREFESLENMNQQAFDWSTERMFNKPIGKTKVIPAEAFECERPYLTKLPPYLPAPYLVHERRTDQYGYASMDGNYYWVPGTKRDDVRVFEYADRLAIYQKRECVAEYSLAPDGAKNQKISPEGLPKPRYQPHSRSKPTDEEEKRLRAMGEVVNAYLDFALKPKGIERHRLLRQLFSLSKKMSQETFIRTLERGHSYQITNVGVLRRIATLYMVQSNEPHPAVDVEESLESRVAYQEGRLTDAPELSTYDRLLENGDE